MAKVSRTLDRHLSNEVARELLEEDPVETKPELILGMPFSFPELDFYCGVLLTGMRIKIQYLKPFSLNSQVN